MNKYEMVIILDAQLPTEAKEATCKQVTDSIGKCEGKVINSQLWLDKQKLSFNIKKCVSGAYYLLNFECLSSAVEKIKQLLKINDSVLRFVIYQSV